MRPLVCPASSAAPAVAGERSTVFPLHHVSIRCYRQATQRLASLIEIAGGLSALESHLILGITSDHDSTR